MKLRLVSILSVVLLFCCLSGAAAAYDCELGRRYYDQARQEQDLDRAGKLLRDSIKVCPTFNAWYLLGRILNETASSQEAIAAYEKSMTLAADTPSQALALARIGQTMSSQSQDKTADAIVYLKNAVKLHPHPPDWMTVALQDLEIRHSAVVVTANEIIRALDVDATANRAAFRNFKANPSINLRVDFDTDEHRLTDHSRQQVVELGEAMMSSHFKGESFLLIGHTDDRGARVYNQALSEKRATTVYEALIQLHPELSGRLKAIGRGEEDLLYSGDTESINRLNRRLEVSFVR